MIHGTITAYVQHRCRCDACKQGWSEYQTRMRRSRATDTMQLFAQAEPWQADAACRGMDPAIFVPSLSQGGGPPMTSRIDRAILVCARCEVIGECAEWAQRTGETHVIAGGEYVRGNGRYMSSSPRRRSLAS